MDIALIETLRWEPEMGFVRGKLHLDRLRASAASLGFAFDEDTALAARQGVCLPAPGAGRAP
jgi:4-amino-4-deoxychorismate lyase